MNRLPSKILVVDDTEATRYAIVRTLRANGYETIEAATGAEALELATKEKPDLVTLDIHLPDILGFEVCRRIKSNPTTADIPVLQVSASFVTSKDRIHGLEGGADSYLTHPFEPPVLLATIRALLRNGQLLNELRISEERFHVALKNAPIMIYTCDKNLVYTWLRGPPAPLAADDFLGRLDADIFTPETSPSLIALKESALITRSSQRATLALATTGMKGYFDLTVEPSIATSGEITGLTVACIDVTERLRAGIELSRAKEEAEFANQAKTRFLSNMSHEIRTPLGVIQGFAELAAESDIDEDERNEFLATIKRTSQNLTKLLGEILDLSKIEAGRLEIDKDTFSLREMLSEVTGALSLAAREKAIGLSLAVEAAFPTTVYSDATRVRQILLNIVNNAIKFTDKGDVKVCARVRRRGGPAESAILEIDVADTGIGMSEDQQTRLFLAFSQADSSITRKFGGTGLGLALSKKLAEALGGELQLVESCNDKGSLFRFSFDAGVLTERDFQQPKPPGERPQGTSRRMYANVLKGLRVLLVEDAVDNRMLFSRYLEHTGALVEIATDGLEAIDLARAQPFDIILMDVQMPNLDGYSAMTILREEGLALPIIALTALAARDEQTRALAGGFTDYLIKPVSPSALVEKLVKYQGQHLPLHS